jgi:GDP-L-fucose synthase
MFGELGPDVVIHAAGVGGGIAAHLAEPGHHFYANAIMALHVIEEARARRIEKTVYLGSADSYAPGVQVPVKEDDLWEGVLEPSSRGYALGKKIPIALLESYHAQYGMRAAAVILTNVYGPGASFDADTSHVVPAMIRRFDEAARRHDDVVVCWGQRPAEPRFSVRRRRRRGDPARSRKARRSRSGGTWPQVRRRRSPTLRAPWPRCAAFKVPSGGMLRVRMAIRAACST